MRTSIDQAEVIKVYTAKQEGCRCGCKGKYYYASAYREYGGKERGYIVENNEVSDKKVKRICKILNDNWSKVEITDGYIFNFETPGGHVYTAYSSLYS